MFPNIRLMIVTVLAAILGIGCGLGLFATFRVNHEPLARLSDGGAPLQLAWEKVKPGSRSSTSSVGYPLAGAAKPITPPPSPPPVRADAEAPAPSAAPKLSDDQIAGDTDSTPAPKADSQTDVAGAPPAEPSEPPAEPAPAAETAPASNTAASDVPAAEGTPAAAAAPIAQPAPAVVAADATPPTTEAIPTTQTDNAPASSAARAAETPSITSAAMPIPETGPAAAPAPPAETASTATADAPPAEKAAAAPVTETARTAAAAPAAEPPLTPDAIETGSAPTAEAAPAVEVTPAAEAAPGTDASQGAPVAAKSGEEETAKPMQNGAIAALTVETPEKPAPSANPAVDDHKAAAKENNKRAVKREVKVARPAPPPVHRPIIKLTRPRTTRTVVAAPAGDLFSQPAYQWTDTAAQTPQTVRRVVIRPRRILLRNPHRNRRGSRASMIKDLPPTPASGDRVAALTKA
jgi:hypothetical protein